MTNWGEKCSWYLEKSGTEEVFILKLHYKPTSVTVMWLFIFILWIVKTSTCSSWLSGYTTLQGICAKSLCFHYNRNESMVTRCLACSLLSSCFACAAHAATPGFPLQQYEHMAWISVVEVWNWDSISSAEKILSIRCNNEVVCLKIQLCHVFCVFFVGLAHPHLSDRRWDVPWEGLWRNWCNVCPPSHLKYCVEMTHCHKEGIEKL